MTPEEWRRADLLIDQAERALRQARKAIDDADKLDDLGPAAESGQDAMTRLLDIASEAAA